MNPRQIARSLWILAIGLAMASGAHAALWVAPGGDDANPGTEDQPLRTVARARDVVRTMNRDMTDDITVFIAGEHRIDQPLEFGPEDSGTNGLNIIYTAAPGARPVISGGYPVADWTLADKGRNLWSAPAPAPLTNSYVLYVNGTPASRTRGRLLQFFSKDTPGSQAAAPDPAARWKNLADVIFQAPGYGSIWSEASASAPLFVENAYELLGMPGEWYFDRPAHLIYYTPRVGEEMATANVVAASASALLRGAGSKDRPLEGIIFKGIRFEYTGVPNPLDTSPDGSASRKAPPPAVSFASSSGIQFLEDEFLHMGTPALELGPSAAGCTVDGCVFAQVSWSALRVTGASRIRIAESRFTYVSSEHHAAGAIAVERSQEVSIENNQIDHYPSMGILATGAQAGEVREVLNLISKPMVGYSGARAADPAAGPAEAGIPAAYRSLVDARFSSLTIPRPPTRVSAEPEDRFAYVTWIPSCQDGGAPVLYYTVSSSTGATTVVPADDFQARGYVVFGDLENGHGVTFAVSAANRIGSSRPSPPTANVIPVHKRKLKPPAAPAIVSVTTGKMGTTLQITPSGSDGGSPVIAYTVSTGPGTNPTVLEGLDVIHSNVAHPFARTISNLSLEPGSLVSVTALNTAGESPPAVVKLRH